MRWWVGAGRQAAVTAMLEEAGATDTRPDLLLEKSGLIDGQYYLSSVQAQAILDLRLHRLTGLEQEKIIREYKEILDKIKELSNILFDPDSLLQVIRDELVEIVEAYGDERRTEINQDHSDLQVEDLIPEEEVVVTLSHGGYAKAQPIDFLPGAAARRTRPIGGQGQGRGLHRQAVRGEFSRHDVVFFQPRQDVLVKGLPGAAGKPRIPRQAHCEPAAAGGMVNASTRCCRSAILPKDSFVFMATSGGTVKKDAAEHVLAAAGERHHRDRPAQ